MIDGDVPGADGFAQFEWPENSDNDFVVRAEAAALKRATKHFYRVHFGTDIDTARTGPVRSFGTHGSETDAVPVRFVVANCVIYSFFHNGPKNDGENAYSGADKHLGYPAAGTILRLAAR